jgi:cytochrome c556
LKKSRYLLALAALTAPVIAFAAAGETIPKEEADGIIFERQNIMLQLEKDAELLGEIAAGLKPADKLGEVTKSIAEGAAASKAAFEPQVQGGRSKPEVWTNWADYSKRLDEFDNNAQQLAELGARGDLNGVTNMLGAALPCKECHDVYRGPKKVS